jgi:hypothetical protein
MFKWKLSTYRKVSNACELAEVQISEEPSNQVSGSVQDKPDPGNDGGVCGERLKVKVKN